MKPRDPLALLFEWPVRHAVHFGLPVALALSFGLHAAGLAAFSLKAIPGRSAAREAGIYFLDAAGPPGALLRQVVGAADPSLFSPSSPEVDGILAVPGATYTPSYTQWKPRFEPLPQPIGAVPSLPALQERPVTRAKPPPPPPPATPVPTRIVFSGELAEGTFQPARPPAFVAPTRQSLTPARLLVGVDSGGRVLHAIPLEASGFEPLDRAATGHILGGTFSRRENEAPAWGTATFLWGSDIERQPQN